jgi:O-antigen biosynthesis protein
MIKNFNFFYKYYKLVGLWQAIIFSLYRLFPHSFILTSGIIIKEYYKIRSAALLESSTDSVYLTSIKDVIDYADLDNKYCTDFRLNDQGAYVWFVPDWSNVYGGGHYTIFRFAQHYASKGISNYIYIYNNTRHHSGESLQADLNGALRDCKLRVLIDPACIPKCSIAFATTWQSAYHVRSFKDCLKRFYFMQDYESLFYAHGTESMQANNSYTFGFHGITGGSWLKQRYESFGGKAHAYRFAVDKEIFYPAQLSATVRSDVKRFFFYGRPSTERRCFELGISSLKLIAEHYRGVEIIVAGLDLKEPLPFKATLLGNLTLVQTGDLYRTCDLGLAFSGTNLSYLPVELMSSGVPIISNKGDHVEWHCKHLVNSFLADPTPTAIFNAFKSLYDNKQLRQNIVTGGLQTMDQLSWEDEIEKVYDYLLTAH